MENFIEWFKKILLAFEHFFHQVQVWFDTEIKPAEWFQNLLSTATDAEEETTGA